ncbi:MAG: hypothetical protein WCF36_00160 [Candidatus Nanopelagicales bacterium]
MGGGVVVGGVDRLRRLGPDVREVAAAQEHALDLHPQLLAVAEVARSAVDLVAPRAATADVEVRGTDRDDRAMVLADRDRLGQVLGNLLQNAVRHTPALPRATSSADPRRLH